MQSPPFCCGFGLSQGILSGSLWSRFLRLRLRRSSLLVCITFALHSLLLLHWHTNVGSFGERLILVLWLRFSGGLLRAFRRHFDKFTCATVQSYISCTFALVISYWSDLMSQQSAFLPAFGRCSVHDKDLPMSMMQMKPSLTLRVGNVVAYIFLIVVNALASRGMLGPTNEKLSKKNNTYITPAG